MSQVKHNQQSHRYLTVRSNRKLSFAFRESSLLLAECLVHASADVPLHLAPALSANARCKAPSTGLSRVFLPPASSDRDRDCRRSPGCPGHKPSHRPSTSPVPVPPHPAPTSSGDTHKMPAGTVDPPLLPTDASRPFVQFDLRPSVS